MGHLLEDFEGSWAVLAEEESPEGTADGLEGLIYFLEHLFCGLVVLEGLLVWVQVAGEVSIPLLDLLVASILLQVQNLVRVAIHINYIYDPDCTLHSTSAPF